MVKGYFFYHNIVTVHINMINNKILSMKPFHLYQMHQYRTSDFEENILGSDFEPSCH